MTKTFALAGLALALIAGVASAQTVVNGDFSTFTPGSGSDYGANTTRLQAPGAVTTWTLQSGAGGVGYPAVISTTQANSSGFTLNGLTGVSFVNPTTNTYGKTITASNNGGNFLAWENASNTCGCYIYQTISGLTVNQSYTVSFEQAGAVWSGATLTTADNWKVGWGTTASNSIANQTTSATMTNTYSSNSPWGFTGWVQQQMTFVASASSMVLSFMANHPTNAAQPPFAMLDGVTITPTTSVPEPLSGALLLAGLGGLAALRRRLR